MDFTNLKFSFEIFKYLKDFFLFDFFILSVMVLQGVVVKNYRLSFQLHYKKKIHNDSFFRVVWTREIRCTIFYKIHFGLNIYPFSKKKFGFERLECRFQFFISLLPNFSNRFAYNATIFNSPKKNYHYDAIPSPLLNPLEGPIM
jgi:hypothetical protein